MARRRRVYIVNKAGHDHSDAERFGEIVFLTEGNLDRFNTNNMYRQLVESMKKSESKDYLLLTSMTILCCMAAAIFARKHGRLNLLLYKDGKYIERTHDLDSLLALQVEPPPYIETK